MINFSDFRLHGALIANAASFYPMLHTARSSNCHPHAEIIKKRRPTIHRKKQRLAAKEYLQAAHDAVGFNYTYTLAAGLFQLPRQLRFIFPAHAPVVRWWKKAGIGNCWKRKGLMTNCGASMCLNW